GAGARQLHQHPDPSLPATPRGRVTAPGDGLGSDFEASGARGGELMKVEILADADTVARAGAAFVAAEARAAVAARGRFTHALSGGHTPWLMLRALSREQVPWDLVYLAQVDERVAPAGDPDRNMTHLHESLLALVPMRAEQVSVMPVEQPDLSAAAMSYAR